MQLRSNFCMFLRVSVKIDISKKSWIFWRWEAWFKLQKSQNRTRSSQEATMFWKWALWFRIFVVCLQFQIEGWSKPSTKIPQLKVFDVDGRHCQDLSFSTFLMKYIPNFSKAIRWPFMTLPTPSQSFEKVLSQRNNRWVVSGRNFLAFWILLVSGCWKFENKSWKRGYSQILSLFWQIHE